MDIFLCSDCDVVGGMWMTFVVVAMVGAVAVWWRRWMAWLAAAVWWLAASTLYADLAPFIASAPAWFGVHAGAAAALGIGLPAAAFLLSPHGQRPIRLRLRRRALVQRPETGAEPPA